MARKNPQRKPSGIESNPDKKARVEEFEFKPGVKIPYSGSRGGNFISDEAGIWDYEAFRKLTERAKIPEPDWEVSVDNAKLNFAEELIKQKYNVRIEWRRGKGDYVEFFTRDKGRRFTLANNSIHTMEVSSLIRLIEKVYGLAGKTEPVKRINQTESWVDKWARENS